ncbi:MAG: hypothetical protein N2Z22_08850 [Turneriella sp.]|nr:hypothetical protein [Turneriella sp.]
MQGHLVVLFATGVLVAALAPLAALQLRRFQHGAGWVYLGAVTFRLVAMLAGSVVIYLLFSPGAEGEILAYATGLTVAWVAHVVVAWKLVK